MGVGDGGQSIEMRWSYMSNPIYVLTLSQNQCKKTGALKQSLPSESPTSESCAAFSCIFHFPKHISNHICWTLRKNTEVLPQKQRSRKQGHHVSSNVAFCSAPAHVLPNAPLVSSVDPICGFTGDCSLRDDEQFVRSNPGRWQWWQGTVLHWWTATVATCLFGLDLCFVFVAFVCFSLDMFGCAFFHHDERDNIISYIRSYMISISNFCHSCFHGKLLCTMRIEVYARPSLCRSGFACGWCACRGVALRSHRSGGSSTGYSGSRGISLLQHFQEEIREKSHKHDRTDRLGSGDSSFKFQQHHFFRV